jgi:probable addiction module antidote protein
MKKLSPAVPFEPGLIQRLGDVDHAVHYLNAAFETGDAPTILLAIQDVLKAGNKSRLAEKLMINRVSLYKMFSRKGRPAFETVLKVLQSHNIRFVVALDRKKIAA